MFLAILNLFQILPSGSELQQKNCEIRNNFLKVLECFNAQWIFLNKMNRFQII